MSKVLVKFFWDCGRSGDLEGLFSIEKEKLEKSYGTHVYFGEVLGKHSEVYGDLSKEDFVIVSEDSDFIEKYDQIIGSSGYNPFDYIEEEE